MPRDSNDNNWIEDLYREDRGDAPPAVLDAAIMEAAAQAIGDPDTVGGRVAPWYRRASRLSAIASAAVVLLTVGIWTSQPGPEPALLPAPPPADASANTELRDVPERATEDRGPPRSQARETAVEFTDPATPLAPPPSPSPAPGPAAAPAQVPAPAATGNNSDPEPDNSAVSPEFRDQAEAKPGARRIEEVIVTAERREASIQDTSISITAFTGDMLSDFGIRNQEDLLSTDPCRRSTSLASAGQTYVICQVDDRLMVRNAECAGASIFAVDSQIVADSAGGLVVTSGAATAKTTTKLECRDGEWHKSTEQISPESQQ